MSKSSKTMICQSDDDLIVACQDLAAAEATISSLLDATITIEDDAHNQDLLDAAFTQQKAVEKRITSGPRTLASAQALATVLSARWPYRGGDAAGMVASKEEFLTISLIDFIASFNIGDER